MPTVTGEPTPAEAIAAVKTARLNAEALKKTASLPSDEVQGKVAMQQRAVSAAENTANAIVFTFKDLIQIDSFIAQVISAAGAVITGDVVVTATGNAVTVADGGTKTLATGDIVAVMVRGQ